MPTPKSKIYQFFNRIVRVTENKSTGVISYGSDNLLPQKMLADVAESGTATLCINKVAQYVYAYGLTNENLGKRLVNKNQTFNQFLEEGSKIVTFFRGSAIRIYRNPEGIIKEIEYVPFEWVRKTNDGNFEINYTYSGQKYDKEKAIYVKPYKGKKINSQDIDPNGEILYYFVKRPGQYHYPVSPWYSGIEDINTDSENSKYELESVTNSFLAGGILEKFGEIDDKTQDDDGKTEWDYIEESLAGFTGGVKDETGASGRQSLLFLNSKSKDEGWKYTPLSHDGIIDAIDKSTVRIAKKVARLFQVPQFLIGLSDSVGFATNIISDNIDMFNKDIEGIKNELLTPLRILFPEEIFELTVYKPVNYIDPAIYTIIQSSSMDREQKINSLNVLFGFTKEQAGLLVGTQQNNTLQ